ncbi:5231_t:CDS:2 [Paraglomus brasilianum]|uniref:Mediator of RNA polymerase II transcription subunit 10 n=1 Tax=Paraglomus brasilianum TaxID=144538 RepID=A0A9N9BDK4_9GLOM|nr:5231_t:CDS:2 [Paraglomus brasilianum]
MGITMMATTVDSETQRLNGESNSLQALEHMLTQLINSLWNMIITVYDMQTDSVELIVQYAEQILECIKEIDKIKDSINIEVPMEAIECLCDGGNPDSFMNEYVREVFTEDQQAHSKTEAIHNFRDLLIDRLKSTFPTDADLYTSSSSTTEERKESNGH